jgi:raffinose/stachyose/melibiose transport system permease protein
VTTTLTSPRTARPEAPPSRPRRRPPLRRTPLYVVVGVLLVIEIYPLVWVLLASLKTQDEILSDTFWELPATPGLDNYVSAFTTGNLDRYVLNSVLTVFPALLLTLALGTAAAFALEVMSWKRRGAVLLLFLAGIMVPLQMILLPLFNIYYRAGLTGTLWPLVITYTASGLPLAVFMIATYFRGVPRELFEAAIMDGASIYRMFWSVGVPLVRNAIFTVGLVQFFFLWNDLLIALTFTNSAELRTIQVGLLDFTGQYGAVQYGPTFAAISVNVFGTLAIYLFLNDRVQKGLAAGSVKG